MKLAIILPAYNEEKIIGKVLRSLPKKLTGISQIKVVLVDDGSQDKTYQIATRYKVTVIRHLINRGQGAALRTGIDYVKTYLNSDIILTFDSDGQHNPNDIQKIIKPLLSGKYDVSLGSRFINKSPTNIPLLKKIILRGGVIFTNIVSNIRLTDTHNGLRALNKKAFQSINITQRGMEHASEIIDEISKNKLRYIETPVDIIYTDYSIKKGQRTSNFLKIGFKSLLHKITL